MDRSRTSGFFFEFFRRTYPFTFLDDSLDPSFELFDTLVVHSRRYLVLLARNSYALSAPGCTKTYDRQYSPTSLTIRHVLRLMALAENESEDWCWRNGGVSFEEPPVGPGIVCRSPEVDTLDRVVYLLDADVFQVITDGQFYSTRSLHQHAESWIGVVGIAVGDRKSVV